MLDPYLSANIRQRIEQMYYAPVNEQARLEQLIRDPHFMASMSKHVGLFSDHGVLHVRDVARQILRVLEQAHGTLLPARSPIRLSRMKGYGVLVAYFHDIGMFDFSETGRAMHPEFAAHALFSPEMEEVLAAIWQENSGNLAWHLTNLAAQGILEQAPELVLREMLALCMAHSKSKVSVATLNDLCALREVMQKSLQHDLRALYLAQQRHKLDQRLARTAAGSVPAEKLATWRQRLARVEEEVERDAGRGNPDLDRYYQDFEREAFRWLRSPQPVLQALRQDVLDTLRALRCADALRQRGTLLTTSGHYEIFVDQHTANAVFGLRLGADRLFLLELIDPIAAGEANVASSELDPACDLRISFHRGAFTNKGATEHAAYSAALVVHDIQQDVLGSFVRDRDDPEAMKVKAAGDLRILLEETDDNPGFVEKVRAQLMAIDPPVGAKVRVAPSLKLASERERALYLEAPPLDWTVPARQVLLDKVAESGHLVQGIDLDRAFADVKEISLERGQVLLDAGAPAAFVYIPLDPGLRIIPESGHTSFVVQPWMPLGATGVIRGAPRNATVQAEQDVRLLMIPKTVYLRRWHHTHSPQSFSEAVGRSKP